MSDKYRMDSHKLVFHPESVAKWMNGENVYPICMEISPSGSCNHRCIFCGLDYLGYKPSYLNKDVLLGNLERMAGKGLKSMVVCGEGEPLLNNQTPDMITGAKKTGLDISLVTNGVLFSEDIAEECLNDLTWIRFSVNAGTENTHRSIQRSKPGDFQRVISNIQHAVKLKKDRGMKTTIGVQLILLEENAGEVAILAKLLKDIGVDYFTVKPYSWHPKSGNRIGESLDYRCYLEMEETLKKLNTNEFRIIFRSASMSKKSIPKCYSNCYGIPFWAYIDADGEVWACIAYIGDKEFSYGNLYEKSFIDIWEGKRKKEIVEKISRMDISGCRELCRLDAINEYLYELKNPGEHANFI